MNASVSKTESIRKRINVNTNEYNLLPATIRFRIVAGMTEEKPLVARNIGWLIKQAELDPTKLSKRIYEKLNAKVPQATIHRIVEGQHKSPRNSTLQPIADYFGVGLYEILQHDFSLKGFPEKPAAISQRQSLAHKISKDENRDAWISIWDDMMEDERKHALEAVFNARKLYRSIRDGTKDAEGGGKQKKKSTT